MAAKEHEVIVIDLGGSYRKLSQTLGGAYIEVECSENYALNPFPSKSALFPKEGDADSTFLQFLKELLQRMIAPAKPWAASEKMILERVLRDVYRVLTENEAPLLGDIEKGLREFLGVTKRTSGRPTSFPRSSLFLPRESTGRS